MNDELKKSCNLAGTVAGLAAGAMLINILGDRMFGEKDNSDKVIEGVVNAFLKDRDIRSEELRDSEKLNKEYREERASLKSKLDEAYAKIEELSKKSKKK